MTEKTFQTLYSRTSTGGIQTWTIQVTGNSYVMITGLIDGKKTTSKPTIVKGKNIGKKNETTPEQQALSEAQSKYDKKAKTGYFENIDDIDSLSYVDPMLAKKYFDRMDKVTFPVIVQCKLNGARCIITSKGAYSRKGEKFLTIPHITDSLAGFFTKYPHAVLDGELFNLDLRESLNEIMKLVRRTVKITDDHLRESREKIRFYVYDGFDFQGLTVGDGYAKRKIAIDKLFGTADFVVTVKDHFAKDHDEVIAIYNDFLADNHEGAMVRFPEMTYKIGGRSAELLKMKPEDDDEAIVKEIFQGTGNWSNVAKTARLIWKNIEFDATFRCSREEAKKIWDDRSFWLDKKITFLYNGLTGLGVPNFARIDASNCFKE